MNHETGSETMRLLHDLQRSAALHLGSKLNILALGRPDLLYLVPLQATQIAALIDAAECTAHRILQGCSYNDAVHRIEAAGYFNKCGIGDLPLARLMNCLPEYLETIISHIGESA
jgi:hypothetical protein